MNDAFDEIVVATVTVTDVQIKSVENTMGLMEPSSWSEVDYTIDEINYGNKEFPLKTDSIQDNFSIEIGKKYVVFYYYSDETKESAIVTECRNLYSIIVLDYIDFYIDLKDNLCSKDKDYLIKNSNHQKVCVTTKTKEKLIQRGYGYFVGTLSFNNWIDKSQGENQFYDHNPRCYDSQYKVRGYCLPLD